MSIQMASQVVGFMVGVGLTIGVASVLFPDLINSIISVFRGESK